MDFTNNPILTFIMQAMGLGARAGTPIGNAMANSTVYADAADGQRMNSAPAPTSVPVQGAGAGRGFVNPPVPPAPIGAGAGRGMVNPPVPRTANRGLPALTPLQAASVNPGSPVASVMAGDGTGPDTTPDNIDAGGGQNFAMMAPVSDAVVQPVAPQPGILSRAGDFLDNAVGFSQPDFMSRFGNALAVAGSADPTKALMMLQQSRAEDEKNRLTRLKASQGETKHIFGSIFGEFGPDGKLIRTFEDPTAAAASTRDKEAAASRDLTKVVNAAVINEMVRKQVSQLDDVTKEAGGATTSPEYSPSVARTVNKLDEIITKIPAINTVDVPGVGQVESPFLASIRDNTYGRVANTDEYKTRRQLSAYYSKDVLADVKQLGANPSNADREFLSKPIPKEDDPIAYQLEYAQEMRNRLHEAELRRVNAATRRDSMATTSGAAAIAPTLQRQPAPQAAAPEPVTTSPVVSTQAMGSDLPPIPPSGIAPAEPPAVAPAAAPAVAPAPATAPAPIAAQANPQVPRAAAPRAPAPSPVRTQATAAFGAYEPDKYEYGINPATGKFARRPKGK